MINKMSFRRVVKLGGSLLDRQDLQVCLPQRISQWDSSRDTTADIFIVVGGGELVDAVRRHDKFEPGDPDVF